MILILAFLKLASMNGESVQNDFKVLKDQGVSTLVGESSLISSIFKPSIMTCMASCSSNPNCITVVYDNSKGMVRNCFLYNRQFSSNELIQSTTSILYETKSDIRISSIRLSSSSILSPTELTNLNTMLPSFTKSVLLYKATRDGFQASAFHYRCDNVANTVTIISNNLNYVFGGFTAAKWSSTSANIADPTGFIFSLRRNGGLTNYKLSIQSSHMSDTMNSEQSTYGPTFGNGLDIYICDRSNTNTGSYSSILCYTPPTYPSGSNRTTFLTGGYQNWRTSEIEVHQLF